MNVLVWGMFFLIFFSIMFSAQTMYYEHQKENITNFDVYNFTENSLVWNFSMQKDNIQSNLSEYGYDIKKIQTQRIKNVIYKTIDWIGSILFEGAKGAMEFGYTHPEYNFGYFVQLLKYWMFVMLGIVIFPILVPLIALIYLAIIGIKIIYKKIKNG